MAFVSESDCHDIARAGFVPTYQAFGTALLEYWAGLIVAEAGEPGGKERLAKAEAELDRALTEIGAPVDPAKISTHYRFAQTQPSGRSLFARLVRPLSFEELDVRALEWVSQMLCLVERLWPLAEPREADVLSAAYLMRCAQILARDGALSGSALLARGEAALKTAIAYVQRNRFNPGPRTPAEVIIAHRKTSARQPAAA